MTGENVSFQWDILHGDTTMLEMQHPIIFFVDRVMQPAFEHASKYQAYEVADRNIIKRGLWHLLCEGFIADFRIKR